MCDVEEADLAEYLLYLEAARAKARAAVARAERPSLELREIVGATPVEA